MEETKNKKVLFVIGAIFLLILVIGGTFAYFQIVANNNATSTTISGEGELVGQVTLNTNITQLRLNLTESIMKKDNIGKVYYASETGEGIESSEVTEGNGRYTLATANVTESDVTFDCNYAYVLSATTTNPVEDASDEDLKVVIIEANGSKTTYTLKQLLSGVTHTGKMKKVTYGVDQTLGIEAYIENTSETQNGLSGNEYTITITPKSGTEGFRCDTSFQLAQAAKGQPAASFMVANQSKIDGLWSSGLEGDGLRYVGTGTGKVCSYDNGAHYINISKDTTTCPGVIKYLETTISNGYTYPAKYASYCPSDNNYYTYECTEVNNAEQVYSKTPDNYICFGTTSASECKANENKYMYRIIGVFADEEGNQHLKLRKLKELGTPKWHSDQTVDTNWGESTLYTELNGSYYLGNTTYDYLQNATWSDKIVEWKWTAVNTKTYSNNGPVYGDVTPANIYLHEMNRSTKTSTIGEWTYPTGKIGIIYLSDYTLSLGDEALAITEGTRDNESKLKTSWLHITNNGGPYDEWTITRSGARNSGYHAWIVDRKGYFFPNPTNNSFAAVPVFYLTSDVALSSGSGTYTNPYIIGN